jgi:hypothetical protein
MVMAASTVTADRSIPCKLISPPWPFSCCWLQTLLETTPDGRRNLLVNPVAGLVEIGVRYAGTRLKTGVESKQKSLMSTGGYNGDKDAVRLLMDNF